ncbi:CPBP family intramembrane glutamic endopeptidase [Faecalicatena contorta]|uniref:CPBP family intramembrane glutamic endopeptidase n=1 Tax=Faecalicatena contorta TaxID=39482 RepID=UPI0031DCE267
MLYKRRSVLIKNILKKAGYFLLALLPLAAAFAIQLFASLICSLCQALYMYFFSTGGFDIDAFGNILLDSGFNTRIMLLYSAVTILLLGTWYRIAAVPKGMRRRRPGQIFNARMLLACFILMVSMQYIASYLIIVVANFRPDWYERYNQLFESAGMNDMTVLLTVYTVILAPVCEELIFRGLMLHFFRKALPFWAANLLQAVLFGVYHMNLIQGIYAFLIGIILGCILKLGRSIYPAILFHILFNLFGSYLDFLVVYTNSPLLFIMVAAAAVLLTAAGLRLYKKGADMREIQRR